MVGFKPQYHFSLAKGWPVSVMGRLAGIFCHQASPRVYEALACRSFLLVDDQKDVKSLFQDRKHLVIFKETEDLRQKITYYLNQSDERKKIASQGYEEIVHKHTYLHRIQEMFSVIEAGK